MQTRFRVPILISMIVALVASFACTWAMPSHACCKIPAATVQSAFPHGADQVAACCKRQALVFDQHQGLDNDLAKLQAVPTPAKPYFLSVSILSGQAFSHLEKMAFVPDQSSRHLELSVLLN